MKLTASRAVSQQGNHHCSEACFPHVPNVPFLLKDGDNDWVLVLPPFSCLPWVSVAWNKGPELSSAGLSLWSCSAGQVPCCPSPAERPLCPWPLGSRRCYKPTQKHPWKFPFLQGTPRGGRFCQNCAGPIGGMSWASHRRFAALLLLS